MRLLFLTERYGQSLIAMCLEVSPDHDAAEGSGT
jgi:hypothetical protein